MFFHSMNFSIGEDNEALRETVFKFAQKEIAPLADKIDKENSFPNQLWKKLGELGLLGITANTKYGGSEMSYLAHCIAMEEISRASASIGLSYGAFSNLCVNQINRNGNEEQKEKYLPSLCKGEKVGALAMSETGSGSDVVSMKLHAEKQGNNTYLLNGSKTYITNGVYGDFVVTVCKTNPSAGTKGISLIVVDLNSDGINRTKIDKLGWHASDTAEISFDNVKVPKENLIGEEGKGFYYLMNGLQLERLIFVPSCIGAMELAISESIKYMKERKSFGQTID